MPAVSFYNRVLGILRKTELESDQRTAAAEYIDAAHEIHCNELKLQLDTLHKTLNRAHQSHDNTMREWANTSAERDHYYQALNRIAAMYAPGAFGIQPTIGDAVEIAINALEWDK